MFVVWYEERLRLLDSGADFGSVFCSIAECVSSAPACHPKHHPAIGD